MREIQIEVPESWDISRDQMPGEKYAFHKMFPHGEDITISIYEVQNGYEISTSAISRTSGPDDTVEGVTSTLVGAVRMAEAECKWWDEYLEGYWKEKSS